MLTIMRDFKDLCLMPGIQGAIDYTHIYIRKPRSLYLEDYFYYKIGGHTIVVQAVIDSKKRFTNLFVGMLGSANDQRILQRSGLYSNVVQRRILNDQVASYTMSSTHTSWVIKDIHCFHGSWFPTNPINLLAFLRLYSTKGCAVGGQWLNVPLASWRAIGESFCSALTWVQTLCLITYPHVLACSIIWSWTTRIVTLMSSWWA